MGNASIKWGYLVINDDEFHSNKDLIDLNSENLINAVNTFKSSFQDAFHNLFEEVGENQLKLKIPFSGYLGTNSYSDQELFLRAFFDDNSSSVREDEKDKPIYLSRDTLDPKIYELFSIIIGNINDAPDDGYGYLSLGFDDMRGYVVDDGENSRELSICIFEDGGCWS